MAGHIGIVGSGLVGSGWAIVFARAGRQVRVFDANAAILQRLPQQLRAALEAMNGHGLVDDVDAILSRITIAGSLADAVAGATYVQESVVEVLERKREVSLEIDRHLGSETIVGSSTSGLPASSFTEGCANSSRFVVAHPVNPPHLIPVVEIVPAPWTDPSTVEKTRALMDEVKQAPVVVSREIPGFILNRLQGALLDEAWSLFDQGYASAEDIDRTIKAGLGLRWSFMGPFETIDLNAPGGVADYAQRYGGTYRDVAETAVAFDWDAETVGRLDAERRERLPLESIEERSAWRDRRLMALIAHKRGQPET